MSTKANRDSPARPDLGPIAIIAAVIVVVVLVGLLGYYNLAPKTYAPSMPSARTNPSQGAFNEWARQRYHAAGGDWTRLAPEDQQRFMDAARGNGKSLFDSFKP